MYKQKHVKNKQRNQTTNCVQSNACQKRITSNTTNCAQTDIDETTNRVQTNKTNHV